MVFERVYEEIRRAYPESPTETLIIGIGGNTGSGKTTFSKEFSKFLGEKGIGTLEWGNDLYQAPRLEKNRRRSELIKKGADKRDDWWKKVGGIYHDTYDRNLLDEHLTRLKARQDIEPINLYCSNSGKWDNERSHSFNDQTGPFFVLHDGVYLFHPTVRKHLDHILLLSIGEEKLVSDLKLGEISEERRIRFKRVMARGLRRGYNVDFYGGFLPLDIHTAKHIRDGIDSEKNLTIIDNSDFNERTIVVNTP
jgi:uridine kinase